MTSRARKLAMLAALVATATGCPDFAALQLPDAGGAARSDGGDDSDGGEGEGEGEDGGAPLTCPADPVDAGAPPLAQSWACALGCNGGSRVYAAFARDPSTGELVGATTDGTLDTLHVSDAGTLVVVASKACPGAAIGDAPPLTSLDVAIDGTRVAGGQGLLCVQLPGEALRTARLFDDGLDTDLVSPVFVDDGAHFLAVHARSPADAGPYGVIGLQTSAEALAITVDGGVSQPGEAFIPAFSVDFAVNTVANRRGVVALAGPPLAAGYAAVVLEIDGTTNVVAAADMFSEPVVTEGPALAAADAPSRVFAATYPADAGPTTVGVVAVALGITSPHLHVGTFDAATSSLVLPEVEPFPLEGSEPFVETITGVAVSSTGRAAMFGAAGFLAVSQTPAGPYLPVPYGERMPVITRLVFDPSSHALWALGQLGAIAYFAPHDVPGPCGDDLPTARAVFPESYAFITATVLPDGRLLAAGYDGAYIAHPPEEGARTMATRSSTSVFDFDPPASPTAVTVADDGSGEAVYAALDDGSIAKANLPSGDAVGTFERVPALRTGIEASGHDAVAAVDVETPGGASLWVFGYDATEGGLRLQRCDVVLGACDAQIYDIVLAFEPATDELMALAVLHDGVAGVATSGVFYAAFVDQRTGLGTRLVAVANEDQDSVLRHSSSIVSTRRGCLLLDGDYSGLVDVDMTAPSRSINAAHVGQPTSEVISLVANPYGGFIGGSEGGAIQIMTAGNACGNEDAVTQPVLLGPARGVRTFGAGTWVGDALFVADDDAKVWRVPVPAP